MGTSVEFQAANITAPYQNGTNFQCIWGVDVDTNSDNTNLDTIFGQLDGNSWITIANDGAVTIYYFLAQAAGTISASATGTGSTVPFPLFAGAEKSFRVQEGRTWLHYITGSSTANLRVYRSSTQEGMQPSEAFKTPTSV